MKENHPSIHNKRGEFHSDMVSLRIIWARIAENTGNTAEWNKTVHYHSFYEAHTILQGESRFQINGLSCLLREKDFILIPARMSHRFEDVSNDYREFVVGFEVALSDLYTDTVFLLQGLPSLYGNVIALSSDSMQCVYSCGHSLENVPFFPSELIMNLYLLLLSIVRQTTPLTGEDTRNEESLLAELHSYIKSNLSMGITAQDTAAHFYMSPRHLDRILKAHNSVSLNKLIQGEKMACIRRLLTETDMTLDAIAQASGYTNAYNMSRAFKKQEGMSPGSYRISYRK